MSWNKRGDFECQSIAIQNKWTNRLMGIECKSTGLAKLEKPEDIHKIFISRKKDLLFTELWRTQFHAVFHKI